MTIERERAESLLAVKYTFVTQDHAKLHARNKADIVVCNLY